VPRPIQSIETSLGRPSDCCRGAPDGSALAEVAGELGLPRAPSTGSCAPFCRSASSSRIRSRASTGWVQRSCTSAAVILTATSCAPEPLNWADWLAARTNESVRLRHLHDGQVLLVHHVFPPAQQPRRCSRWARCCPCTRRAMGKVLLAYHPYLTEELGNGKLPRFTSGTITDPKLLAIELEQVREQGWAGHPSKSSSK